MLQCGLVLTMFKFGFSEPKEDVVDSTSDEKEWKEAEQVIPSIFNVSNKYRKFKINSFTYGDVTVHSFSEKDVINYLKEKGDLNPAVQAESNHSDLVTAEYEGGLKIWESTNELLKYLNDLKIDFQDKHVLDLGCGCGVAGLYTLLKGAYVDFQDYNKEVIESMTIPNTYYNSGIDDVQFKRCNFYCGDWKSFSQLLPMERKYDYILTSETIYNPENYKKLHDVFVSHLKDNGVIYLAAKTHYFGVGGGTREFEKHIEKQGKLTSRVACKCKTGVQQEILEIKKV